jgi:hypothetical protein
MKQQLSSQSIRTKRKYGRPGSFDIFAPFEYELNRELETCFVQLTELYSCTSAAVCERDTGNTFEVSLAAFGREIAVQ